MSQQDQDRQNKSNTEVKPRGLSVKRTSAILGFSESHGWKMVRDGQLRAVNLGRRTIVPASEIDRILMDDTK